MHNVRREYFNEEEVQRSAQACKFDDVAWNQVFGSGSNAVLAQKIIRENPLRYRELKRQYLVATKQIKAD